MKSICFLTENIWREAQGGAELQVELQKNYLSAHGYSVKHVYLTRRICGSAGEAGEYAIRRSNRWVDFFFGDCRLHYFRRIYRILIKMRPDIVIHRDLSTLVLPAIFYAKKFGAKVILQLAHQKDVEPLVLELKKNPLAGLVERRARRFALLAADEIIAQAQYQNDLLFRNFGRRGELVMRNAHPQSLKPSQSAEKGLSDFVVCWIANFKEWKRPDLFVDLAERMVSCRSVKFVMIGRPKKSAWGRRVISRIEGCSNIEYLGELSVDEVNRWLSGSDVFVNTSEYEGFPNTFIQAWLNGVPVLSLNVDPDCCLSGLGLGRVCKDIDEMAKAVCEMEADRTVTRALGEQCRAYAEKMHSTRNFEVLRNLIGVCDVAR